MTMANENISDNALFGMVRSECATPSPGSHKRCAALVDMIKHEDLKNAAKHQTSARLGAWWRTHEFMGGHGIHENSAACVIMRWMDSCTMDQEEFDWMSEQDAELLAWMKDGGTINANDDDVIIISETAESGAMPEGPAEFIHMWLEYRLYPMSRAICDDFSACWRRAHDLMLARLIQDEETEDAEYFGSVPDLF